MSNFLPQFNLGYAASPIDTQYANSLGNNSFFGDWATPSSLAAPMSVPGMPMLNSINTAPAVATPQSPGFLGSIGDSLSSFFRDTPWATSLNSKTGMKTQGLFDMGLGAAQAGLGAYLGFQNLGIAKDTLDQNKRAFNLNFNAQRNLTNSRLADRQAARVASNPTAYAAVADYMKQNGI